MIANVLGDEGRDKIVGAIVAYPYAKFEGLAGGITGVSAFL